MQVDLQTMRALRSGYAALAIQNPEFFPIFERIDEDFAEQEALASGDPVTLARAHLEKRGRAA
ncbi:hypothetical protein [Roseinatronobacter sp. NSM]|uniref:hypothetical protein n=1 Tax=Roseinatronobacter sp. NSM TaxID=3457785 RepID=UPI004037398D